MSEPIQKTVDVLVNATNVIIEQGVTGALSVILMVALVVALWLLFRERSKRIKRLEKEADK